MGDTLAVHRFDKQNGRRLGALYRVVIVLTPRQGAAFPRVAHGHACESQAVQHRNSHQDDQDQADDNLLSLRQLQIEALSFHSSLWKQIPVPLFR